MTNSEVTELRERVDALSAALFVLLTEREESAMKKAGSVLLSDPRVRAMDAVGLTVRPWFMLAPSSAAKGSRALPLDAVVADIQRAILGDTVPAATDLAAAVRKHKITWDEIGVAADGSVNPDALPPKFGSKR